MVDLYRLLAWKRAARLDFRRSYPLFMRSLMRRHTLDEAMQQAVGGDFEVIGILERELLIQNGLRPDGYVIDVGCGAGRLAKPLSGYLAGNYLGIDIVPEMVEYARRLVKRPDWRFEVAQGLSIPEEDGKADMVCFFSVFTHLLHEQTYIYLQEARRVLRPAGRIVFSFHEFAMPSHWASFELSLKERNPDRNPLTMFMSRDAIKAWASHLQLTIAGIYGGEKPFINVPRPIPLEDGRVLRGRHVFGQSVCILAPQAAAPSVAGAAP
jgi:SAM-dependent methyltransferase